MIFSIQFSAKLDPVHSLDSLQIFAHYVYQTAAETKIANFTDIFSLHIADDDGGVVGDGKFEDLVKLNRAGQVEDICASLQAIFFFKETGAPGDLPFSPTARSSD